jgi:hypothetical protein
MTSLPNNARANIDKGRNTRTPVQCTRPPEKEAVVAKNDEDNGGHIKSTCSTDMDSSDSVTKPLLISDLMYQRDWERVYVSLFDKETGRPIRPTSTVLSFEGCIGCTFLHFLCRYQPPLKIVEAVVGIWPELSKKMIPATKQTALHVACQYGARSDVVKFLLEIHGEAAMMQDINGRLPLHLACRPKQHPPTQMDEDDEENGDVDWIKPGSAVVRALCGHNPKAANAQDKDGCNPLELALTTDDENSTVSKTMFQLLFDTSKNVRDLECREQAEEARRQDEKFTCPGYTPSAAQDLLAPCRFNSGRSYSDSCEGTAQIANGGTVGQRRRSEPKNEAERVNLPPYKVMLERYTHQRSFLQPNNKLDVCGHQTFMRAPSKVENSPRKSPVSPMA